MSAAVIPLSTSATYSSHKFLAKGGGVRDTALKNGKEEICAFQTILFAYSICFPFIVV